MPKNNEKKSEYKHSFFNNSALQPKRSMYDKPEDPKYKPSEYDELGGSYASPEIMGFDTFHRKKDEEKRRNEEK